MVSINAELQVEERVRYFTSTGTSMDAPVDGRTHQQLAGWVQETIYVAFELYKVIRGEATFSDGRKIQVSSGEFDHSPKYYIDGEVFPYAEAESHHIWLACHRPHPHHFAVRDRFDIWEFESERPEVVKVG